MAGDLIARARAGDAEAFRQLTEPLGQELQLHCYRILGSVQDAEDALQETLVAAWRGLNTFEKRSSIRTWLYRIATRRCLDALRAGSRHHQLESDMAVVDLPAPSRSGEVSWLEPYPDTFLEGFADSVRGPDAQYEAREAISIAFVTALQVLPPRQRAVLILRDVLGFRAAEVAHILGSTGESVTSALKRARATLRSRLDTGAEVEPAPLPASDLEKEMVERFVSAFEAGDLDGLVTLLRKDVVFAMPPLPFEWHGREKAREFLAVMTAKVGPMRRLVATRANGQPAFCLYIRDQYADVMHAGGLLVLTLAGDRIAAITRFEGGVLSHFGFDRTVPA
jgi:RNA polymerase sigma-70 factor (TIGR02960 family)